MVQIDTGLVRGATVDGVYAWRGIPFVKPPVEELRWRSPQPAEAWSGVRDALDYGANCAQLNNDIMWFVCVIGYICCVCLHACVL